MGISDNTVVSYDSIEVAWDTAGHRYKILIKYLDNDNNLALYNIESQLSEFYPNNYSFFCDKQEFFQIPKKMYSIAYLKNYLFIKNNTNEKNISSLAM